MELTFLGHQGWMIKGSDGKTILLDPLYETMGNGSTKLNVWPNRKLSLEKMGKIEALIISHEHADHFNIETLIKIREINRPEFVYVPNISTYALKNALRELKFTVIELGAFDTIDLGTLSVTPLPSLKSRLEPDVYSLLFRDEVSNSSFYTTIDSIPTALTVEYLKEYCPVRTVDNFTNNFVQRIHFLHDQSRSVYSEGVAAVGAHLRQHMQKFDSRFVLISGQGWSYKSHLASHNEIMFTAPHDAVIENARVEYPDRAFSQAVLGGVYKLHGFQMTSSTSDFIEPKAVDPRGSEKEKIDGYQSLVPYIVSDDSLHLDRETCRYVEENLGQFISLGAHKLSRALYLEVVAPEGPQRGLFLELRSKFRRYQWRYDSLNSRFSPLPEQVTVEEAKKQYSFGLVGFISDFDAILNAREEAHLISENSMLTWNTRPDLLDEPADVDFMQCFRPQYRPRAFEEFYSTVINKLEAV